jgi:hypothetical protein
MDIGTPFAYKKLQLVGAILKKEKNNGNKKEQKEARQVQEHQESSQFEKDFARAHCRRVIRLPDKARGCCHGLAASSAASICVILAYASAHVPDLYFVKSTPC